MKQPEVVRDLMYEEMLNKEIQRDHHNYLKSQEELKEANALAKKQAMQLKSAIVNFKNQGLSIYQIALGFNISEEEVNKILSE